jgi:hypothetical protein
MTVHCPVTQQSCVRNCTLPTECLLHKLKRGEDIPERRHEERRKDFAPGRSYFIATHHLGALEYLIKDLQAYKLKASRRVEFNHIAQVLHTLKLVPHSEKIIGLGLGCSNLGELGLLVICTSPHQLSGGIPSNYAQERAK